MPQGRYVVIEGHDGTGKSTQVDLLAQRLSLLGLTVTTWHEPGGSAISDRLREIIKDGRLERNPATDLLMFTAARAASWPAMKARLLRGEWVIASRNYLSSIAYQAYGGGLTPQQVFEITGQFLDKHYLNPDLTVILDYQTPEERTDRLNARNNHQYDTFERQPDEFQARVAAGYRRLSEDYDLPVINAELPVETVAEQILSLLVSRDFLSLDT